MAETVSVSLKRPRSTSNITAEEPDEKYSAHLGAQPILVNPAALAAMTDRNGVPTTASFPILQYYHMIHQMQNQQMEIPMIRKEREEPSSGSSSRRQTISTPSMAPRPIRVPTQPLFNPLQFFPNVPQLAQQPDAPGQSPSPARPHSPQHTYHVPSFQRADEEVFSKFVDSVRKLAAKLTAERS